MAKIYIGSVIPKIEFSTILGLKAKSIVAIIAYFFSMKTLERKYIGMIVITDIITPKYFCKFI
jgi:hypothetical protein